MTILAMVNADKEGQIESRMMKARQMEEIREARREEAKARKDLKKSKLVSDHFYIGNDFLPPTLSVLFQILNLSNGLL